MRSPNIGEALKRLCEAVGYKTISDVHFGDWGRPMGLIICEIKHRYPELDFFNPNLDSYPKESPVSLEDLYDIYPLASAKAKEDESYMEEAREFTRKLQNKEKGIYELYEAFTSIAIDDIKDIYHMLNATFDLYEGERDADEYIPELLDYFKKEIIHKLVMELLSLMLRKRLIKKKCHQLFLLKVMVEYYTILQN